MGIWTLIGTLVIQLIVAVYTYGKLTERVSNISEDVDAQDAILKEHSTRLNNHGERISHLEGRRHT